MLTYSFLACWLLFLFFIFCLLLVCMVFACILCCLLPLLLFVLVHFIVNVLGLSVLGTIFLHCVVYYYVLILSMYCPEGIFCILCNMFSSGADIPLQWRLPILLLVMMLRFLWLRVNSRYFIRTMQCRCCKCTLIFKTYSNFISIFVSTPYLFPWRLSS